MMKPNFRKIAALLLFALLTVGLLACGGGSKAPLTPDGAAAKDPALPALPEPDEGGETLSGGGTDAPVTYSFAGFADFRSLRSAQKKGDEAMTVCAEELGFPESMRTEDASRLFEQFGKMELPLLADGSLDGERLERGNFTYSPARNELEYQYYLPDGDGTVELYVYVEPGKKLPDGAGYTEAKLTTQDGKTLTVWTHTGEFETPNGVQTLSAVSIVTEKGCVELLTRSYAERPKKDVAGILELLRGMRLTTIFSEIGES